MWKCKEHSIGKHIYHGIGCQENNKMDGYSEIMEQTCQRIDNQYISTKVIECQSPKCAKDRNAADSYDTNVHQVICFVGYLVICV